MPPAPSSDTRRYRATTVPGSSDRLNLGLLKDAPARVGEAPFYCTRRLVARSRRHDQRHKLAAVTVVIQSAWA
jgi:hypothetical protein